MAQFLVGSSQTHTTIQSAVDAVVAAGMNTDHEIVIDNGFVHSGTAPNLSSVAMSGARLTIRAASGRYTLELDSMLIPTGSITVKDVNLVPLSGLVGERLYRDNDSADNIIENFTASNPNNIDCSAIVGSANWRNNIVRDGVIHGFNIDDFRYAVYEIGTLERVTIADCSQGVGNTANAVDCVVGDIDHGNAFNNVTNISYCASDDASATGTGSIASINFAAQFVDAANNDYTLAASSALIGAGSTGNNIGADQTTVASQAPVVNDQTFSVADSASNGTVIGTLVATDSDGTVDSYAISGTTLAINSTTGQITLADNAGIVAGTPITATATVTDNDGGTDTATVTVNVTNSGLSFSCYDADSSNAVITSETLSHVRVLDSADLSEVATATSIATSSTGSAEIDTDSVTIGTDYLVIARRSNGDVCEPFSVTASDLAAS